MSLPEQGAHQLQVDISSDEHASHWGRCFDNQTTVVSFFKPVGNIEQGYWIETTGRLSLKLTVDVIDSGWYWNCLGIEFCGLPIPRWLVPETNAYKKIENNLYRFCVQFSLPIIVPLVSYQGLLQAQYNE